MRKGEGYVSVIGGEHPAHASALCTPPVARARGLHALPLAVALRCPVRRHRYVPPALPLPLLRALLLLLLPAARSTILRRQREQIVHARHGHRRRLLRLAPVLRLLLPFSLPARALALLGRRRRHGVDPVARNVILPPRIHVDQAVLLLREWPPSRAFLPRAVPGLRPPAQVEARRGRQRRNRRNGVLLRARFLAAHARASWGGSASTRWTRRRATRSMTPRRRTACSPPRRRSSSSGSDTLSSPISSSSSAPGHVGGSS
ncbi:hypothetical protein C8J57DRAFT_467510 [Mycena rebaudengoi]|nr:hypothetical protein C8J57DRAFT_467510 [Mycena rebaudengoi]